MKPFTTRKFLHKKNWNRGAVQVYVDPPPIPLSKSKNNDKLDKYFVTLKLHRDPTSENSDLYEFKMALFDNGELEEFLLFLQNFQMTLKASGMLAAGAKIRYLHMIVRGKALRQLDTLSVELGSTTSEH